MIISDLRFHLQVEQRCKAHPVKALLALILGVGSPCAGAWIQPSVPLLPSLLHTLMLWDLKPRLRNRVKLCICVLLVWSFGSFGKPWVKGNSVLHAAGASFWGLRDDDHTAGLLLILSLLEYITTKHQGKTLSIAYSDTRKWRVLSEHLALMQQLVVIVQKRGTSNFELSN